MDNLNTWIITWRKMYASNIQLKDWLIVIIRLSFSHRPCDYLETTWCWMVQGHCQDWQICCTNKVISQKFSFQIWSVLFLVINLCINFAYRLVEPVRGWPPPSTSSRIYFTTISVIMLYFYWLECELLWMSLRLVISYSCNLLSPLYYIMHGTSSVSHKTWMDSFCTKS